MKLHNWKIIDNLKALVENLQKQNDILEREIATLQDEKFKLEKQIAKMPSKISQKEIGDMKWEDGETIPLDEDLLPAIRKTCESCWKEYETHRKWERRCEPCRTINAPYRKKVFNDTQEPF